MQAKHDIFDSVGTDGTGRERTRMGIEGNVNMSDIIAENPDWIFGDL